MNKKHVSKVGKCISMACLLFVCATVQSCRDEYYYDDREPDFLGASIYDYLQEQGDFTYFLRVIDDLNYAEVLKKTGSKTLFVADDKAFMEGIRDKWGEKMTYDSLSLAHKRIILYGAMLDNAYLLEMLSKLQSTGANAEPTPGQCLRRVASLSATDTIGLFTYKDLPKNNPEWDIFNPNSENFYSGTVRLALDETSPMLTFFMREQLYMKGIGDRDLQLVVGDDNASLSDMYVFDKKVLRDRSDVACKNGYVHQLDGLLIQPSNMAEELRTNGDLEELESMNVADVVDNGAAYESTTQIFSRLIDRFAVPVPISEDAEVAQRFNELYNQNREPEQIFVKRYYAEAANVKDGRFATYEDINKESHDALGTLRFDPGWNQYREGTNEKEMNMAAIFAPSDRAVVHYFAKGSGKELVRRYGGNVPNTTTVEGLLQAIDSIPVDIVEAFVNNHMQVSFNGTVPSKFKYIMNDARDEMGVDEMDLKKTIMANNGVVYVMDTVYSPAEYVSVVAPIKLGDSLRIFNQFIEDEGYKTYLLSMDNDFTVVVTADDYMVYYDPYSEIKGKNDTKDAYKFQATVNNEGNVTVKSKKGTYKLGAYDVTTNSYTDLKVATTTNDVSRALKKQILEYNILLGDVNSEKDKSEGRKYYMSKGYGSVMVERGADGMVTAIAGGRERQNGAMVPVAESFVDQENGTTLQLGTSMIQPPTQSVYDVLSKDNFKAFRDLCINNYEDAVLKEVGVASKDYASYRIFQDGLVRMFNTYHYTVYVPTEQALEDAIEEQGLPTWEILKDECDTIAVRKKALADAKALNDSVLMASLESEIEYRRDSLKAGVDLLVNFIRYHFQDNAVFVDNPRHALATDRGVIDGERQYDYDYEVAYETSAMDATTGRFGVVVVQSAEHNDKQTIAVRGDFGEDEKKPLAECVNVCYVVNDDSAVENVTYNVMTRDIEFAGTSVSTSSYAVVHQIDGCLKYSGIFDAESGKFVRQIK